MLDAQQLREFIRAHATRSAFRLELLDAYEVLADGTDFHRYVSGASAPTPERKEPWLTQLRSEKAAGFHRYRVHVLTRPLTPYLAYECEWGYLPNTQAGEDIRIADRTGMSGLDLPVDHDFWLFDDTHAVAMRYDDRGRFLGAEVLPDMLLPYRQARDLALAVAEPFTVWWARHPQEWRENRAA